MKTAIFTICSRNYLAYALTLQKSVRAAEPDKSFFIYLADELPDEGMALEANIVPARALGLDNFLDMAFRYTVMEFNTAIKADCFLDLLTRRGFDAAIYLDPDIRVFSPLTEVHKALETGASIVLTPHILAPSPKGTFPDEAEILKSGVFNLGFGAFAGTEESLAFINWWATKLHAECYSAPEKGLFVDQRFVDLAPCFIEHLAILRHPGYNVAYWNIAGRHVERWADGIHVNGAPLVFFHFSGVQPGNPDLFSKHLGGRVTKPGETVRRLVRDYLGELADAGHNKWSAIPYAYGHFRDGSEILAPMRRAVPSSGSAEDWFEAPHITWWNKADPEIDQEGGVAITRLMSGIHSMRPDLQAAFPLAASSGRRGYHAWFCRHGAAEYCVPNVFLDPKKIGSVRFSQRYLTPGLKRLKASISNGKRGQHKDA